MLSVNISSKNNSYYIVIKYLLITFVLILVTTFSW